MKNNLNQDIILGHSAAGFHIGQDIAEVSNVLSGASLWDPEGNVQLSYSLHTNLGWLRSDGVVKTALDGEKVYTRFYYKNNIIELCLTNGKLWQIVVGSGYLGTFMSDIKIGSTKDELTKLSELKYDEFEEMYYFLDTKYKGIAFEIDDRHVVTAIAVHDLSIDYGN